MNKVIKKGKVFRVAARYGRALFSAVPGTEHHGLALQLEEIIAILEDNASLLEALQSPAVLLTQRREVATALSQALVPHSIELHALLTLLAERRRFNILPAIAKAFTELVDRNEGVVRVKIVSARELSSADKQQLREIVCGGKSDNQLQIEWATDNSLIAGLLVYRGDETLDLSAHGQLRSLRRQLLQGI